MKKLHLLLILVLLLAACGGETASDAPLSGSGAEDSAETTVAPAADTPTVATEGIAAPETVIEDIEDSAETSTDTVSTNGLNSNYLASYSFEDVGFGTQVIVTVDDQAKTRAITSNALPNHETGEFPNPGNPNTISAQDKSWTFTTEPTFIGTATPAREPGVAINGVKFEPDTAERATCETGEVHSIEAIQDVTDLGLDFNLAHVQPTGEYHYHGVSDLLVDLYSTDQDLVHVGFAADGHLIYYSKSGAYQASYRLGAGAREGTNCTYTPGGPNGGTTITFGSEKDGALSSDWDYDASFGQLDECNGSTVDGQYIYLVTNDYPYIPRCLMGESTQAGAGGGQGGGEGDGQGNGQGGGQGGRPDFAAAASVLGISEQVLLDAIGQRPPHDFDAAAETLGISAEAIQAAVEDSRGGANAAPPPAEEGNAAPEVEPEPEVETVVGDGIENVGTGRAFVLPGNNIYPEGVSYNAANGKFYVGATSDGTLYEGDVNGDLLMSVFSEGGADGRAAAIGTKVDDAGNLWVAGGGTGQMWVYNTVDGALVAQYTTAATDSTFINDLAITESGVYFTDSFRPIIWRITDLTSGEAEAWLDLTGSAINYVQGFNLNGIIATADGNDLIVVHSGEGELYRINIPTKAVTWIETGTMPLTAGDGLELIGKTLYVTRNNFGEIVPITLSDDLTSGVGGDVITSDLFGYPTTIAYTGNTFLVANSQFDNRTSGTPDLPFTVAQIPVSVPQTHESAGLDTALFFDGALAEDAVVQDCTLSDGTQTSCYAITIAGYPSNHEAGPFCPETTADTADAGGIWFDGNSLYEMSGAFILGLADLYNDSNWKLYDDDGNVNITDTAEAFDAAARPDVDPAYQNHCVEGRIEWLDGGEPIQTTVLIPTTPVIGASPSSPAGSLGVTLNGVIIDGSAPVDAILSAYTIAAFDDCGGHINPVTGYHMHGARGCSEVGETVDGETPIFGYALDGHPIHSPLAAEDVAAANLDVCLGHTTEADGYHYHAASVEQNAILSCFVGVTVESAADEGGRGGQQGGGAPDFAAVAQTLGVSEDALRDALGAPPSDFDAAAAALGITVEALQAALDGQ